MYHTQAEVSAATVRTIFMERNTDEDMTLMSQRARRLIMTIYIVGNLTKSDLLDELDDIPSPEMVFHPELAP